MSVSLLAGVVVSLAPGCALIGSDDAAPVCRGEVPGNRDAAWVLDSLRDWVSYAEQVSVVSAVAERSSASKSLGDFEVGARVVAFEVEENLWVHPNRRETASVGSLIDVVAGGWEFTDGKRLKNRRAECPEWIHVGERHVMALVYRKQLDAKRSQPEDNPFWDYLTESIPVTGNVLTPDPHAAPFVEALASQNTTQVRAKLRNTKPYPLAVKYADLPPFKRIASVSAERAKR